MNTKRVQISGVTSHDFRARNNGRSTDNVRTDCGVDRSNFRLAGHVDQSKFSRIENDINLKWYCDENHIFAIEPILKHKQVACLTRKMLFTIFKYLFSFQRYLSFLNMQISQLMTSYTQPNFDQI